MVGAAVAGLAPRLTTILSDTNDGPYASYGPAILLGLSNAYPTVKQWLYETLVPATADYFFDLEHVCGSTAFFERFAAQDFTSYFADGLQAFDDPRYLAAIGNAGIMGRRGPPAMPLLVVDATNDHVSSIGDTVELVSTYCSKGGSVDFVESTTGGHLQAVEAAADAAMTWLDLAFAGESHTKGCRRWNLTGSAIEPLSAPASSTALPSTTSSSAEYSSTKSSMTSASTRTMAQTEISVPASSSSDSTTTITRTAAELTTTVKSIIRRPAPSLSSSRRATTLTSTVDAQPTGSSSSRRTTTITSTVAAQTPDTSSSRRTTTITFTNEAALPSLSSSRRTTTLTSTVEAPSSSESKKRRTTTLTRTVEPLPAPTNLETRMPLSVSRTVSPLPNVRAMTSSPIVVSPRPTPQVTTMVSCKTLTSTLPYMTVSCQTKLVNGPVSGAFKPHAVIGSWALDFLVITVTALAFSLA